MGREREGRGGEREREEGWEKKFGRGRKVGGKFECGCMKGMTQKKKKKKKKKKGKKERVGKTCPTKPCCVDSFLCVCVCVCVMMMIKFTSTK